MWGEAPISEDLVGPGNTGMDDVHRCYKNAHGQGWADHSSSADTSRIIMDALDSRKPSDVTVFDPNQMDHKTKSDEKKDDIAQFENAPPQVQQALEIISAKEVSRTEIMRVSRRDRD